MCNLLRLKMNAIRLSTMWTVDCANDTCYSIWAGYNDRTEFNGCMWKVRGSAKHLTLNDSIADKEAEPVKESSQRV